VLIVSQYPKSTVRSIRRSHLPAGGHIVGVDLGGTRIRAAVAAPDGTIEAEADVATDVVGDGVVAQLLDLIHTVTGQAGRVEEGLLAAVIGVPGVADNAAGVVRNSPNVPALGRPATIEAIRSGLPVLPRFENDVNLAALAEWRFGGHDCESVAALALGTGIGLGAVVRGELLWGEHLAAGEVAALPFGGDPFSTLGLGRALESVVSGSALVGSYRATGDRQLLTGAEVFAAAAEGDVVAREIVDQYARNVARAAMTVIAVLDPGVIALTGGVGSDPFLFHCVTKWLDRGGVRSGLVVPSTLGARAGLVGALSAAAGRAEATYVGASGPGSVPRAGAE
jgi:glucokinase